MAELVLHTDMFLNGTHLPLAKPAQNQAALDASIVDPTRNFTEGAADSGTALPSSCHLLPQKGRVSQDQSSLFGNPNTQSRAHVCCFALSHSVSAHSNGKSQADCAGISCLVALSKGAQAHLAPDNESCLYPHQFPLEYSTAAGMLSCEEAVYFLNKGQGDPAEQHGHEEDRASTYVKVNDLHAPSKAVCTGSAHGVTEFHDPSVLLSMASVNSCEESTSLHEDWHAGCDDSCDDMEDSAHVRRIRGGSANGVHDPPEEVLDPYLQQADADATSSPQPCSSECSSAISMVSNGTPEITSTLDSNYNGDAIESCWTDAKHGSYLDYMEMNFVKNLYSREYCASDVCGQHLSHQASQNSSPRPSTLLEFKSWQSGDWQTRSMLKPPLLLCIPLALRPSPWVNYFQLPKVELARQQIKIEDVGVDGEEEVDSPSIEVCGGALGRDHTSGSNFGYEERLACKIGCSGSESVAVLKHEFALDLDSSSRQNTKKRRLESNIEQDPARQSSEKYVRR